MKLTDFLEPEKGLPTPKKKVYLTVLALLCERQPLAEVRARLGLTKQGLNKHLTTLKRKGLVKPLGDGVYEPIINNSLVVVKSGKPLKTPTRKLLGWLSTHNIRLRFNFKSRIPAAAIADLKPRKNGHRYVYDNLRGINLDVTRATVFADVFGLRGGNARALLREARERAQQEVSRFARERGVSAPRFAGWVNKPHWVLEDAELSRLAAVALDLRLGDAPKEFVGLRWWVDGSHKKTEFDGEVQRVLGVVDEFKYLLEGGLRKDMKAYVEEQRATRFEINALRQELQFAPKGGARPDVA